MRAIESEGETVEDAIAGGLAALGGIRRSDVEVEVLREPKPGSVEVAARVRLTMLDGASTAGVSRETSASRLDVAHAVLEEILRHLVDDARVEMTFDRDAASTAFVVHVADAAVLIGRHGATLDAVEHLLNRVVAPGDRISLDVAGYRERRRETLEAMALRLAEKARSTGRRVDMDPMAARDRRTVHLALSGEPGVTTHSEGEGRERHLVIEPTASARR
jgi:spoIIIJ-associated protein